MSRLNNALTKRIYDTLDASEFTIGDFDISFPEDGQNLAVIQFRPVKAYSLIIMENGSSLYTRETPGKYKISEDYSHASLDHVIRRIPQWTLHIKEDLRASNPIYDDLNEMRKNLEEQIESHVTNPDQHFSRAEAEDLKTRLDEIVSKFQELEEQKAITDTELETIKREVSELKANVSTFSRGTFFKTAGNKILNLIKGVAKSDAAKEILMASTKKFLDLPPG